MEEKGRTLITPLKTSNSLNRGLNAPPPLSGWVVSVGVGGGRHRTQPELEFAARVLRP